MLSPSEFRFAFRIVGPVYEPRRLVDAGAAFAAHAAADPRSEPNRECYLSAFQFPDEFRRHLETTGSTANFAGPCWSPWVWFDFDAQELEHAHADAGAFADVLAGRYRMDAAELLLFFSGSKGFHIGLPTSLWNPEPSTVFHRTARRFAENLATIAAVTLDMSVYDKVRVLRAPNSRHPKTGLHKRRLAFDELLGPLPPILEMAKAPAAFGIPTPPARNDQAVADWQSAAAEVTREADAMRVRQATARGAATLNRATVDFICNGAGQGDRHRMLFSAAANLGEFGCPLQLAIALLEEAALDSGLPPKDVLRGIECGLQHAQGRDGVQSPLDDGTPAPGGPEPVNQQGAASAVDAAALQQRLAELWAKPSTTNSSPPGRRST